MAPAAAVGAADRTLRCAPTETATLQSKQQSDAAPTIGHNNTRIRDSSPMLTLYGILPILTAWNPITARSGDPRVRLRYGTAFHSVSVVP